MSYRPKNFAATVREPRYETWHAATTRIDQVRDAGFDAYAVATEGPDMIVVFIGLGRRQDFSLLPMRRWNR